MLLLISIHAPRTGSDATDGRCTTIARHFNPRSPHGERLLENAKKELAKKFQSTLPARGATLQRQHIAAGIPHFNPRSPHGERPCSARRCGLLRPISIHAPRTGSDGICIVFSFRQYGRISIHAPRTGSDNSPRHAAVKSSNFNPRSPHGERLQAHPLCAECLHFNPRSPHGERRCNFNRRER